MSKVIDSLESVVGEHDGIVVALHRPQERLQICSRRCGANRKSRTEGPATGQGWFVAIIGAIKQGILGTAQRSTGKLTRLKDRQISMREIGFVGPQMTPRDVDFWWALVVRAERR
jgi:hypothetical protein